MRLDALDRYCPLFIVLAFSSTALIMLVNGGAAAELVNSFAEKGLSFSETVLYPFGRLCGSLAIWTFLPSIMGGSFQRWTLRNSTYIFATFCSHYLMLTILFFAGWLPVFGDRHSDFFIVWFLAAPLLSLAVAILIVQSALKIAPSIATLITGGRMRSKEPRFPTMARKRSEVLSN